MNIIDFEKIIKIAKLAGEKILPIYYKTSIDVSVKLDSSPLASAGCLVHKTICEQLMKFFPGIPIVSGEDAYASWEERKMYDRYWLIDPLDGTKELIKKNGEFTINIALIENQKTVLGVVYAPAKNLLYYGSKKIGAYKISENNNPIKIEVSEPPKEGLPWRVVGGRSHQCKEFIKNIPQVEVVSMGSSLKSCLVAEGSVDLYPRLEPTCEWETAAAQAIVEAAGGQVLDYEKKSPLIYNAKKSLLNPFFIVSGKYELPFLHMNSFNKNIVWQDMPVTKKNRAERLNQKATIIWFTGLSASGKSTTASALEQRLFSMGYSTYLLDGDNLRHGLCSDLGFSDQDRNENIRRVGEVAKLMVDAGFIVLASFISPFVRERTMVRQMVSPGEYIEVYMNVPFEECERRDPKGLYKKARMGEIKNFTGLDSPYEEPENPEIEIKVSSVGIDQVLDKLICDLKMLGVIDRD